MPSKPYLVEVAGKRGIKQLIIVFDDAPEENKETAEPKACEGDRRRLYFRAVGELAAYIDLRRDFHRR